MPDDFDPTTLTDEQIAAVLRYAGTRNSERRKRSTRACAMCGAILEAALTKRTYCSDACRVRAAYYRDKARDTDDPTAPFREHLSGKGWMGKRPHQRKATS